MSKPQIAKALTSVISGLIASFWGIYGAIITCVLCVICIDVVTGLIKAKATGTPITSEKGNRGFWRKMALITALAFGIFLDTFIPIMLNTIYLELPFSMPIGTIVGCYIVINESISIIENINAVSPTALPKWIKTLLEGAGKKIDNGGKTDEQNG